MALPKLRGQSARSCRRAKETLQHENILTLFYRKYGNVHRQLRALSILDGLIQNAGSRFQRAFADEPLLERLRVAATDPLSDNEVKQKCSVLFRQWAVAYKSTPGLERIASLYKQLPQRKKPLRQEHSKVIRETDAEAELEDDQNGRNDTVGGGGAAQSLRSPTSPTSTISSSFSRPVTISPGPILPGPPVEAIAKYDEHGKRLFDKHGKKIKGKAPKPFNLEKEKPQLLQTLASSSVATTNLMNAMKLINRENKRVSEDAEVAKRFETCKALRRQVLRYIQHVESEQWLGSLIHANDELVTALIAYEVLDKSVDDDSDSEDERNDDTAGTSKGKMQGKLHNDLAGLSLGGVKAPQQPPRPGFIAIPPANSKNKEDDREEEVGDIEEEDEDDPFADRNAIHTPKVERPGMTW